MNIITLIDQFDTVNDLAQTIRDEIQGAFRKLGIKGYRTRNKGGTVWIMVDHTEIIRIKFDQSLEGGYFTWFSSKEWMSAMVVIERLVRVSMDSPLYSTIQRLLGEINVIKQLDKKCAEATGDPHHYYGPLALRGEHLPTIQRALGHIYALGHEDSLALHSDTHRVRLSAHTGDPDQPNQTVLTVSHYGTPNDETQSLSMTLGRSEHIGRLWPMWAYQTPYPGIAKLDAIYQALLHYPMIGYRQKTLILTQRPHGYQVRLENQIWSREPRIEVKALDLDALSTYLGDQYVVHRHPELANELFIFTLTSIPHCYAMTRLITRDDHTIVDTACESTAQLVVSYLLKETQ